MTPTARSVVARLELIGVPALPPLAWCLVVGRNWSGTRLVHGPGVTAAPEGFSEGAWAGPFSLSGLGAARYVVGTGAIVADRITVRASTHLLERLFAVRADNELFISNSLPLVLAASGSRLASTYVHYEADLLSFLAGPAGMRRHVPLADGRRLEQVCWQALTITPSLELIREPLPNPTTFGTFGHYREHVTRLCGEIVANATSSSRVRRYGPLTLVSRGYDSPACSVFAAECGARRAMTFASARSEFETTDDDGSVIGAALGLEVEVLNRDAYRHGDGLVEALFLASGGGGEDVVLSAAARALGGSVVFTGFLGDTLWGLSGRPAWSERGRVIYPGGGSIGEFRLHTDFVHLPIPMLDLRSHASLLAISTSREMAPWRLGGEYDRPIPRRIAEERGVRREDFGRSKRAVTEPMYYDERGAEFILGPEALADFERYAASLWPPIRDALDRAPARVARASRYVRERVAWRAEALGLGELARHVTPRLEERWRRKGVGLLLVSWGVDRVARFYRDLLPRD